MTLYRVKSYKLDAQIHKQSSPVRVGDIVEVERVVFGDYPKGLLVRGVFTELNWTCCLIWENHLEEVTENV